MGVRWVIWMAFAGLVLPAPVVADPPGDSRAGAPPADLRPAAKRGVARAGVSIGTPRDGALRGGRLLREDHQIRYLARYAESGNFWGIDALVGALRRGARAVSTRWPGSRLSVGELSARRGGFLRGHRSHRSGRDADIGFYARDERGRFARLSRFLGFGRYTPLSGGTRVRFDDARNWALVKALLSDPEARVQYLFVSRPIRARLLAHAHRRGDDDALLRRAAAVMLEPVRAEPHDDHFHLRIYCPQQHRDRCQDAAPYWPWYDGTPPDGTYAALPTIRWRPVTARARTRGAALSGGQARAAATARPSR
ncbi:MAG: penicillin-insensitive murein endopeptidase [Myxococcales bacterium]